MLSLCVLLHRPGGLDILADSFTGKEQDCELVVVDDWPGRVQRGLAQAYLQQRNIPLGWYGVSKAKAFPNTLIGFANAVNTAALHAKGDYLVFLCDFTRLPSNWLETWQRLQKPQHITVGVAQEYEAPKPEAYDDIVTWPSAQRQTFTPRPFRSWIPGGLETFYWGCPAGFFDAINGLDERTDHCAAWNLNSLAFQIKTLGYQVEVKKELICHMIDHRPWDDPKKEPGTRGGLHGLWRMLGEVRSAAQEPIWTQPSLHPYTFSKLKQSIQEGKPYGN